MINLTYQQLMAIATALQLAEGEEVLELFQQYKGYESDTSYVRVTTSKRAFKIDDDGRIYDLEIKATA